MLSKNTKNSSSQYTLCFAHGRINMHEYLILKKDGKRIAKIEVKVDSAPLLFVVPEKTQISDKNIPDNAIFLQKQNNATVKIFFIKDGVLQEQEVPHNKIPQLITSKLEKNQCLNIPRKDSDAFVKKFLGKKMPKQAVSILVNDQNHKKHQEFFQKLKKLALALPKNISEKDFAKNCKELTKLFRRQEFCSFGYGAKRWQLYYEIKNNFVINNEELINRIDTCLGMQPKLEGEESLYEYRGKQIYAKEYYAKEHKENNHKEVMVEKIDSKFIDIDIKHFGGVAIEFDSSEKKWFLYDCHSKTYKNITESPDLKDLALLLAGKIPYQVNDARKKNNDFYKELQRLIDVILNDAVTESGEVQISEDKVTQLMEEVNRMVKDPPTYGMSGQGTSYNCIKFVDHLAKIADVPAWKRESMHQDIGLSWQNKAGLICKYIWESIKDFLKGVSAKIFGKKKEGYIFNFQKPRLPADGQNTAGINKKIGCITPVKAANPNAKKEENACNKYKNAASNQRPCYGRDEKVQPFFCQDGDGLPTVPSPLAKNWPRAQRILLVCGA